MTTSRGSRTTAALAALLVTTFVLAVGPAHAEDGDTTDPVPVEATPSDPAPSDPTPSDPTPTDPAPADPAIATVTARADATVFGRDATVRVAVTAGDTTPTGTVHVLAGTLELGQATLDDDAAVDVTFETTEIRSGSHDLTVRYDGDGDLGPAETTTTLDVARAPTRTVVTVEGTPRRGRAASLVATVYSATGSRPIGSFVVRRGDTVIATGPAGPNDFAPGTSSHFQVPTDDLPIGTTRLTVTFEGDVDRDDSVSSSTTLSLGVGQANVRLAATTPAEPVYGTATRLDVSAADPDSDVTGSGIVMVRDGTAVVGVGVLDDGRGTVRIDRTALAPGRHDLTVSFAGSDEVEATEAPLRLDVARSTSAVAASVGRASIRRGQTGATVKVEVSTPWVRVDDGPVSVRIGKRLLGRGTVDDGVATVPLIAFGRRGERALTVRYGGNALIAPSRTTTTITVTR